MHYSIIHSTLGRCRIRVPNANDSRLTQVLVDRIGSLAFVREARINAAASSLIVSYKSDRITRRAAENQLLDCLQAAICQATPDAIDPAEAEGDLKPLTNQWQDLGIPVFSLSLALMAAPFELPPFVIGMSIAAAASPWFKRAADSLVKQHHASTDLLDSVWMTMQTVQGQFIAPALKTSLVEFRRSLRGTVAEARSQTTQALLDRMKQPVCVDRDGRMQTIDAIELQAGDRVWIRSGEPIPADGLILTGVGLIDCCHLFNTTAPTVYTEGQEVYATSLLLDGEILVLVQRVGTHTRMGLVAYLMQAAPVHDTHIGAKQAELVKSAVLPTLMLGGTVFVMTGNLGAAISPFQLDFGSGIPISIATTVLSALTHAVRNGIYIRSGRALERLAQVDTFIFDASLLMQGNTVRSDAAGAIAHLQQQGKTIYLISHSIEAVAIAAQLGIHADHLLSHTDAHQQATLVRGLQSHGKTIAVIADEQYCRAGLACADVSVAIAQQGDLTEETADVVLLDADLRRLRDGLAIAQRAMEVVYENTAIIVLPNLIMQIGGGMVLGVNPVWNVIVNNGSAIVAEFVNGSRPVFETLSLPSARDRLLPAPQSAVLNCDRPPLTFNQKQFAQRLGLSSQAVTHQRSKPHFSEWSRAQDPEGKAWRYDADAKRFVELQPTHLYESASLVAHSELSRTVRSRHRISDL